VTAPILTSASAIIRSYLEQWGLEELQADVDRLIKDGLGTDAIQLQLQQTDAYKRRFRANADRQKAGLPVLSPAEYLSAESAYRQALQSYGLPASFYDSAEDFHDFIARDISPQEVTQRAQAAQQTWLTTDIATRTAWRDFYGLSDGAAIAAILDPAKALPIVQRMATAAQLGGLAGRNGLNADRDRFEQYADLGITAEQASDAFTAIGATLGTERSIASRFGVAYDQATAEQARLGTSGAAVRRQQELAASEQALFSARPAADQGSLTRRQGGRF
jgi:hypothetical protein